MRTNTLFVSLGIAALTLMSACTVKDVDQPGLAGPSTFGTSILLRSNTDTLIQDGASQASISITAFDAQGNPKNIPLRAEITVGGVVQDFGRLSTKQPIANGTPLIYTAPPASALAAGQVAQTVSIVVTPMDGTDFRNEVPRTVDLRLVPQGVILPTNPNLAAAFDINPSAPQVLQVVTFSAAATTNNNVACASACSYSWDFGDGTSGTGVTLTHTYRTIGTYTAVLTVTDARGATSTSIKAIPVAPGTPPTATFTFSPTPAVVDQMIFFNASGVTPAPGRTIVRYDWDFGKGTTGSGVTVSKAYDTEGIYTVTLTVTDDAGSKATTTQTVAVTNPQPKADFTVTPASPARDQTVTVNASSTSGPSPITSYVWDFGTGSSPSTGTGISASTNYPSGLNSVGDTRVITLTVTDSAGRTSTTSKQVTLK
jgi:PKD repeat protein